MVLLFENVSPQVIVGHVRKLTAPIRMSPEHAELSLVRLEIASLRFLTEFVMGPRFVVQCLQVRVLQMVEWIRQRRGQVGVCRVQIIYILLYRSRFRNDTNRLVDLECQVNLAIQNLVVAYQWTEVTEDDEWSDHQEEHY